MAEVAKDCTRVLGDGCRPTACATFPLHNCTMMVCDHKPNCPDSHLHFSAKDGWEQGCWYNKQAQPGIVGWRHGPLGGFSGLCDAGGLPS